MRKGLFLLIVFLLYFSTVVYADMAGPAEMLFPGFVSNPDGAVFYDKEKQNNEYIKVEKGTLPFGSQLTIRYLLDGYYAFIDDNNNNELFIKEDDVTLDSFEKYLGEPYTVKVFDEIKLVDNPFERFYDYESINLESHVIGTIPPESSVEVRNYLKHDDWNNYVSFCYATYNGISGWIGTDECAYLDLSGEYRGYVTSKDIKTSKGTVVPMFTLIEDYYVFEGEAKFKIVIYYNGEYAKLDVQNDIAHFSNKTLEFILSDDAVLYEQADLNSQVLEEIIPKDTTLQYEYFTEWNFIDWIYTTYNGKNGWCYIGEMVLSEYHGSEEEQTKEPLMEDEPINVSLEDIKTDEIEIAIENEKTDFNETNIIPIKQSENTNESVIPNVTLLVVASLCIIVVVLVIIVLVNKKK